MKKALIIFAAVLAVVGCIFMFAINPSNSNESNNTPTADSEVPEADGRTEEILEGVTIEQRFKCKSDSISEIAIVFSRLYDLGEECGIYIELDEGSNVLVQEKIDADSIQADHRTYVKLGTPLKGMKGKELTLKIFSETSAGTGLCVMINSKDTSSTYSYKGQTLQGTLCFAIGA